MGGIENVTGTVEDTAWRARTRMIFAQNELESIAAARYKEVSVKIGDATVANYSVATGGQTEYGLDVHLTGPVKSIKALLSEFGIANHQNGVLTEIHPEDALKEGSRYQKSKIT